MTYAEYKILRKEVLETIKYIFCQMKKRDFKSYALFLASAYKDELYRRIPPYVPFATEYVFDQYIDETRNSFMSEYLVSFVDCLRNPNSLMFFSQSYNINLQLMIYTHIWESKLFLKRMVRMANILAGNGYVWDIPFVHKNRNDQEIDIKKGQLISNTILSLLRKSDDIVYQFLSSLYDSNLRNSFAHSMYMIDENEKKIKTIENAFNCFDKSIGFSQWEDDFVKIALFSYHFSLMLDSYREEVMIELSKWEQPYISYTLPDEDIENGSSNINLKLGLSNLRGYTEFQFFLG